MRTKIKILRLFIYALLSYGILHSSAYVDEHDGAPSVVAVAAASTHSLYITNDGKLWGMGRNSAGQLGDGTNTNRSTPILINTHGTTSVIAVAAGGSHSLYITSGGKLWAMGSNDFGQLGDSTTVNRNLPVQITAHGEAPVIAVAAGYEHSLYLTSDGKLWAMGRNDYGQLGIGGTYNQSTPVQVTAHDIASVIAISADAYNSMYQTSDGKLWAMGNNYFGQLGDGTTTDRHIPVQVTAYDVTNVKTFATGINYNLFVMKDGTLWTVGGNDYGQLGIGSTTAQPIPVQVTAHGTASVVAVSANSVTSLYVTSNGQIWGMGANGGQLGDGTRIDRSFPVQATAHGTSRVMTASNSGMHSLYTTSDGKLWGMGYNIWGQLGDGSTTDRITPAQIDIPFAPIFRASGNLSESSAVGGDSIALGVQANANPSPAFQWQISTDNGASWMNVISATSSTLSLANLLYSDNGKRYRVIASNIHGFTNSAATTLTEIPLAWLGGYGSQTKQAGQTAIFKTNIVADSTDFTFVWKKMACPFPTLRIPPPTRHPSSPLRTTGRFTLSPPPDGVTQPHSMLRSP